MNPLPRSARVAEVNVGYFPVLDVLTSSAFNGALASALSQSADGVLTSTAGAYPDSILPQLAEAKERGIPVFVMNHEMWEESGREKVAGSAIPLELNMDQALVAQRGLERIIDQQKRTGINGREGYQAIALRAQRTFSSPAFYDSAPFIELMINPDLKALADSLPKDAGPIVIDCGHIDSPTFQPTLADAFTLEEGLVFQRYLRNLGHEAKVSILLNETYLLDRKVDVDARIMSQLLEPLVPKRHTLDELEALREKDPEAVAKNDLRFVGPQAKRKGIPYLVNNAYLGLLWGFGLVSDESRKKSLQCELEGNLIHATRQDLRAAVQGDATRFAQGLNPDGRTYTVQPEDGKPYTREIATEETRAPTCNLLSGRLNRKHQDHGFKTIIYLRDEETGECGIRAGTRLGRELYGVTIPVHAVFYIEHKGKIDNFQPQKL